MANIISQILGKVDKTWGNIEGDISGVTTSYPNKLWRAAILLHRATHYPHAKKSKVDPAKGHNTSINEVKRDIKVKAHKVQVVFNTQPYDDLVKERPTSGEGANKIILYNLTSKPYEYIVLQNRPNSLEFKGETTWASIKSMGRNTPMYHYTGSEDTVQFNISWYCDDPEHLDEVVNKCRFLEAWTKSNGYVASPPIIKIQWGNSDIFKDHTYILTSATYTLNNFNDYFRVNGRKGMNGKLLPSSATQELIFKRVSATNLSWEDILPKEKMDYTRGLNKQ